MTAMIQNLINGEQVDVNQVPSFTTLEEAKPFIIECGKAAREIAKENGDSFFIKMAMGEVEGAYYKALHADCGFMVYNAACLAFGWLDKMVEYKRTGRVAF